MKKHLKQLSLFDFPTLEPSAQGESLPAISHIATEPEPTKEPEAKQAQPEPTPEPEPSEESQRAFEQAIKEGRLSANPKDENFAGNYMYMGKSLQGARDAFKHILTRQYLH